MKRFTIPLLACLLLCGCATAPAGTGEDKLEEQSGSIEDTAAAAEDTEDDATAAEESAESESATDEDLGDEEGSATESEFVYGKLKEYPLYAEFIKDATECFKRGMTEEDTARMQLSDVFIYECNPEYEIAGYALIDVDQDGVYELLVGSNNPEGKGPEENAWDSIVYNMYTIVDGKMVQLINGWGRNRYYLLGEGRISNEGSSGAAYSVYTIYAKGLDSLTVIDGVFTDYDDDLQKELYYRSDKEPYEDTSNEITEADFMAFTEEMKHKKITYIPFLP